MKKLSLNRFWLSLGSSLIVLALLWILVLLPKASRRSRLQTDIKIKAQDLERAVAGTPSRQDVLAWSRYKAKLLQDRDAISAFYADHSKALRQWFPDLRRAPNGDPTRGAFVARYQDEARALEAALSRLDPPVRVGEDDREKTTGFHWEDLSIAHWDALGPENETPVMRELQKRYWARLRVAQLALHARVPLKRIVDFRFLKRLHEKFPEGGAGETPLAPWPGLTSRPTPETALVRPFTFGFAVELPYSQVPRALEEFVTPGPDGLLVTLLGTHVTIREQNAPKVDFFYDEGDEDQREALKWAIEQSSKPRNVILTVTCQILDYEPGPLTSK